MVEYQYLLSYKDPHNASQNTRPFKDERDIIDNLVWIEGCIEKQWYTLKANANFELNARLVHTLQMKYIANSRARLGKLERQQEDNEDEIDWLKALIREETR